jgi:hypothetical protein
MFTKNVSRQWGLAVMFAFLIGTVYRMVSSTASAQVWDKQTTVTFSAPVAIPGIHLRLVVNQIQ